MDAEQLAMPELVQRAFSIKQAAIGMRLGVCVPGECETRPVPSAARLPRQWPAPSLRAQWAAAEQWARSRSKPSRTSSKPSMPSMPSVPSTHLAWAAPSARPAGPARRRCPKSTPSLGPPDLQGIVCDKEGN